MSRLSGHMGALVLLIGLGACAPDSGQMRAGVCGDRMTVERSLAQAGETPEAAGVNRQSGEIYQLFLGSEGWSFVSANRFGASCMVASGTEWRAR